MKTKKQKLNNFIKIPNNDEGKELLRLLRKLTKECNSKFRIRIKYRSPKEGAKANAYGDLNKDNSNQIALYLDDTSADPIYQEDRYTKGYQEGVRKMKSNLQGKEDYFFDNIKELVSRRESFNLSLKETSNI